MAMARPCGVFILMNSTEHKKLWRQKNREKLRIYDKNWRLKNPEKYRDQKKRRREREKLIGYPRAKKYYQKHKEALNKKNALYFKLNPWCRISNSIRSRCNNSKHYDFRWYGAKGIQGKITSKEIKELWFRDKAYLMKKPSIDRIDNDGHYEVSNCRFIELVENIKRRWQNTK